MAGTTENKVIVGDVTDSEITGDCITVSAEDMKSCNITGDYVTVFNEGEVVGGVSSVNGMAGAVVVDGSNINVTYDGETDTLNNTLPKIGGAAVDVVESGNMNAVTSNAVNAALGEYDGSKNSNGGYCKFPNGLIIQWGITAIVEAENDKTKTVFPLEFPNALLNVQGTHCSYSANKGDVYYVLASRTGVSWYTESGYGWVSWIAIGY